MDEAIHLIRGNFERVGDTASPDMNAMDLEQDFA
jgi:hypothetical protein